MAVTDEARYCAKEQLPNRAPDRLRGSYLPPKSSLGAKRDRNTVGTLGGRLEPALVLQRALLLSLPSPPVPANSPRYLPPSAVSGPKERSEVSCRLSGGIGMELGLWACGPARKANSP